MSRKIEIDEQVWEWLTKLARPLEDTPNSVLRRVAGIDKPPPTPPPSGLSASEALRQRFLHQLRSSAPSRDLIVRSWPGGGRHSRATVELCRGGSSLVLYVKVRSEGKGFWGLSANRLDPLRADPDPWCVVLLLGPRGKGYLLSSDEVERAISEERWTCSKDGEYKINEGPDLANARNYNTHADLAAEILGSEFRRVP